MKIIPHGRFFAVYDEAGLVCICVYKVGALEVVRRLTERMNENRTEVVIR